MENTYSQGCLNAVVAYFKKENFNCQKDSDNGRVIANFSLKDCMISSVRLVFDVQDHGIAVYAISPLNVKEDKRLAAAEYLTRANYGLMRGNFELDFSDGEVRYKHWLDCSDEKIPTHEMIDYCIDLELSMFDRYGDGLVQVMMGMSTAEDAIRKIEN